jgi:uncharacterized protein YegP (UPF0339 family)
MTGTFELFIDEDTHFRFRLKAPDGTVVAVSRSFPDKPAAVSGIRDVREYAGMGLITDLCPEVPVHGSADRNRSCSVHLTSRTKRTTHVIPLHRVEG